MITFIVLLAAFILGIYFFMKTDVFGANPDGLRLSRIQKSTHYKNGVFSNLSETPMQSKEFSIGKTVWKYFNQPASFEPAQSLPSVKTDLRNTLGESPAIIWFGHSSYLIKINGKNILVDPVFSGNAGPVSFMTKNFHGSNVYSVEDFPVLDIVLLTHDHYDHLDYLTILQLKSKANLFCTSIGVGAHLEKWGVATEKIIEFDWWENKMVFDDIELIAAPARHFSGRGFERYKSLWSSFVVRSSPYNLYVGGDSGYDSHFKTIGEKYGPFDIALLECGQYNTDWPYIHMTPEETVQASIDLQAKVLMPVHWGKFKLSLHSWKEPIERACSAAAARNVILTTPLIGQPVIVGDHYPNDRWWTNIS